MGPFSRHATIERLAEMIVSIKVPHPLRVAVDGVDAAGKTILADELVDPLVAHGRPVVRASADGFHKPRALRYKRGPDSPEGYYLDSFQYEAVLNELLIPLGPGGCLFYRSSVYDYRTETPVIATLLKASSDAILLFDGVFLLRPELVEHWDYKIFVDVSLNLSVERARARDVPLPGRKADADLLRIRYDQRYVPGQRKYFKDAHPKENADVILDNTILDNPKLIEP